MEEAMEVEMRAEEAIGLAINTIGRGEPRDYVVSPTAHAEAFREKAPALAAILASSAVNTTARQYEQADRHAMEAQSEFKRIFNRSNTTVLATAVFVALFLAAATVVKALPGWLETTLLVCLSLGGVICGALASKDILIIRQGGLLEDWMTKRATAETTRLDYFDMVAKPSEKGATESNIPIEAPPTRVL
jgi:hypothetical protein